MEQPKYLAEQTYYELWTTDSEDPVNMSAELDTLLPLYRELVKKKGHNQVWILRITTQRVY